MRALCTPHAPSGNVSTAHAHSRSLQFHGIQSSVRCHSVHATGDRADSSSSGEHSRLGAGAIVAAVALAANVPAAQAEQAWTPRRHHRHIGERFTASWADAVVEGEETDREAIRQLTKDLTAQRKRADEEASKRKAAENKVRQLQLQQSIAAAEARPAYSLRIAGAEVGPVAVWLLALGSAWALYANRDAVWGGGRGRARGRWVYDRSLGGKKVWVADAPGPGGGGASGALPPTMSDSDFAELTSVAAAARATAEQQRGGAEEVPAWWQPPPRTYAAPETKAERQEEANRLLARLEQAKNRGQDYPLSEVLALRTACQAGGGLTVEPRTVGGRDALFRAVVEAGVRAAVEPGSVDLGGEAPLVVAAGMADALKIPPARGARMLQDWLAAACRSRIVDAITAIKQADDSRAILAILQLASILDALPALDPSSPGAELIAGELANWAEPGERRRVLALLAQIAGQHTELGARMLGLDPGDAAGGGAVA